MTIFQESKKLPESDVSQIKRDINKIVRERNISLDRLINFPVKNLKFDLHWFTCTDALDYVKEIVDMMKSSYKPLLDENVGGWTRKSKTI